MSAPAVRRQAQSVAAEARFRGSVAIQGGRVLGEFKDVHTPVETICAAGHRGFTVPRSLARGGHVCKICGKREMARKQLAAGEAKFRAAVTAANATMLGEYIDSRTRVECLCAAGHRCQPRPSHLLQGIGICATCSERDSAVAGAKFRRILESQGAEMLGAYAGAHTRVRIRCAAGHYSNPLPNQVRQGGGLCPTCSRRDRNAAEAAFRKAAADADIEVLGDYVTARVPVLIRCARGHLSKPMPDSIQSGQGFCKQCRYRHNWDTFYVVVNRQQGWLKFGVTHADERPRLRAHQAEGYRDMVRVIRDFPNAYLLEQNIIATLRDAGIQPVHRREYFDMAAMAVVLDIVDGWTG